MSNINKYHGITSLTNSYRKKYKVTEEVARETIKNVLTVLEEAILDPNLDGVQIVDFLTIQKVHKKAKVGRNPRTKEEIIIEARNDLKVKTSQRIKNELNK